ncbi:MAG TPA: NlpC/P60 family protein [Acidimicrobiales bacterium]|nr:NlpC/P60 family protein [Acidimicrobiales bacterium]
MFLVRRRGTTRTTPLVVLAASLVALLATPLSAGAQSIKQTQGQIATLSAELSQQEKTSEITANQYDADKANLVVIDANIVKLQAEEVAKRSSIATTSAKLVVATVRAYVLGAADAQILSLFNQKVTNSDARTVYEDQVIGDLNQLRHTYEAQKKSLDHTITQVAQQRVAKIQQTNNMQSLLAANIALENRTRVTLQTVTSRLKGEIINYEIQAGVAAAKAHNQNGETQAINAASVVGGQSAANQVISAIQAAIAVPAIAEIAGSKQGLAAVAYAKSQIGVPYVWGGETPGVGFDCSGLVQWAWIRAGITIPRTTQTQWPAMHHVILTQLQPGDLLFYYNLDGDHAVDHVVMYIGSGPWGVNTTIAAAHSGTTVALAPLFTSGLIGAARP